METAPINCVIVDDEEMAAKVIESHLEHIPDFKVVGVFHSAVEAFLALDNLKVDVLFLDIQMPKLIGIDFIKMLKKKPLIVLTTAYREYALEGFELDVTDYLLKPIGLRRFLETASRLKTRLRSKDINTNVFPGKTSSFDHGSTPPPSSDHMFIKSNRSYHKIEYSSILHVEAIKNHVKIVTATENYISLFALSEIEKNLSDNFLRIHRSYIVNTNHITRFDSNCIENAKGQLSIGRTYKEVALNTLKKLKKL